MKKIISGVCLVLCLHSFTQPPIETGTSHRKLTGEKVLLKAIAVIVNPDGNKKLPSKQVNLSPKEPPYHAASSFVDPAKA